MSIKLQLEMAFPTKVVFRVCRRQESSLMLCPRLYAVIFSHVDNLIWNYLLITTCITNLTCLCKKIYTVGKAYCALVKIRNIDHN